MIESEPFWKNNMSGSFLLFRGLSMMEQYIEPFRKQVGKSQFHLPGSQSCSKNPF